MPITRVPIVHRFGIISHSKRLELQERLARKVIDESTTWALPITAEGDRNNQYGIDEEFVQQFNEADTDSEKKFELHEKAKKIFLRAKRKAGLRDGGIGNHVTLHQAWIELSLLAQCNSRSLQEGALSALYYSLYHAPIRRAQIESLLKLAYISIQWLAETAIGQPYLRSGELGLLKVSHLVFLRLYYHHLAADIEGYPTERIELFDIVQAFEEKQENYRPFPSSLLLVRIICRITDKLKIAFDTELRQMAEAELLKNSKRIQKTLKADRNSKKANYEQPAGEVNSGFEESARRKSKEIPEREGKRLAEETRGEEVNFNNTELDQSTMHEITKERSQERFVPTVPSIHHSSPTLWHSLDLWRILTHTKQDLKDGLKELVMCSLEFISQPMLDSILALHTLAEVAKIHHETLNVLQFIAKQEILGFEENFTTNQRKQRKTKKFVAGSSNQQRDIIGIGNISATKPQLEEEHNTATNGRMPTMGRQRDSLDSVPSFLTDLDEFLDPKPIGSDKFLIESDQLFEAERKTDNLKQERDSPVAKNKESSLEIKTSHVEKQAERKTDNFKQERDSPVATKEENSFEIKTSHVEKQAEINVTATEGINDRISQSQDKFDATDQSEQGITSKVPGQKQQFDTVDQSEQGINNEDPGPKQEFDTVDQSEQGITSKVSGQKQQFDTVDQSEQGINNKDPGPKQQTIGSGTIEIEVLAVEDTNLQPASSDGESISLSGGSLADVSSLASNQPCDDLKTRSSKRKMRRRAKNNEIEMSAGSTSDESENELIVRFEKCEDNGLEFLKRESSVSLEFSDANHELKPGSTLTITRPNTNEEVATTTTKWPWELIVTYARCMGDICIHGNNSQIQRDALIGCKDNKAGLIQLLKFQLKTERENTDWSWRVRHVTVQELMRVCHWREKEPIKDGLRNTAWGALLSHHSVETDRRVIEAYKIARTEVSMDLNSEILDDQKPNSMTSVYSRICTNLAIIHFTIPRDIEAPAKDQNTSPRKSKKAQKGQKPLVGQGPLQHEKQKRSKVIPKDQVGRVSIRNEVMIATALQEQTQSYGNRSWQTVQEVVEDQWKKELMEEYELVERQRQDDVDKQVKNIERSINTKSLQKRV
eukprot:Seg3125.2 transcript_id=Seg3125.2/GoldUCD/mRNA.D3Y31 product="Transmembrane protein 232" protein_id=Seg3125.2/GoldUCD/D3Y31